MFYFISGIRLLLYSTKPPSNRHYDAKRIYGTTKLANLLTARELARRLRSHNVVSNAVHPGSVQTDLFRNIPFLGHVVYQIMGMLFKSAEVREEVCFNGSS